MKRTTLLTLAVLAGWGVAAAGQTPEPADSPKNLREKSQVQKLTETQAREQVESRNAQGTGQRFVDADGDGICDNCDGTGSGAGQGRGAAKGRQGRGPGNGSGNQGVGPRDGSGFGAGAGSGNCDGTGPKSRGNRRGRR